MAVRKTIMGSMYLTPRQHRALKKLSELTCIPQAVLVREAVDDLLAKYAKKRGAK